MAEKNVKTLYTVRMAYDITLEADNEADAIHSAQYENPRNYSNHAVENLSQAVIRSAPLPAPEPEAPQGEMQQALPAEVTKDDEMPF